MWPNQEYELIHAFCPHPQSKTVFVSIDRTVNSELSLQKLAEQLVLLLSKTLGIEPNRSLLDPVIHPKGKSTGCLHEVSISQQRAQDDRFLLSAEMIGALPSLQIEFPQQTTLPSVLP